jgi:excinuclease ABC subunit A
LTGRYLADELRIAMPSARRKPGTQQIKILGARAHNLKKVDLTVPLRMLVAITGVSGSGKSTLLHDVLYQALAAAKKQPDTAAPASPAWDALEGAEFVDEVVLVDQSPIGRTPRSNPVTYIKAFDGMRELYASLPEAKKRGFSAGHFSFNIPGGRCETCQGNGTVTVEMQFLADVELVCEECRGQRFKSSVLEVRYHGKNIHDVLQLTAREALAFFTGVPKVVSKLRVLNEIGLGYLRLGQSATTLSGGEAQRLKLAAHLTRTENAGVLYILDEPTTGLHFDDIAKLLAAFRKLLESGASLLVIEHNLDVIKSADWLIDLGPEGGDQGGKVVATGTPEQVARNPHSHTGRFLARILNGNGNKHDATRASDAQAKGSANGASKPAVPSGTIANGAGNPTTGNSPAES